MYILQLPSTSKHVLGTSRRHERAPRPPSVQQHTQLLKQARPAAAQRFHCTSSQSRASRLGRRHCTSETAQISEDFDLLGVKVEQLSKELQAELRGSSVFLVGMMGTGKSTVGKMLSYCLKYCFFDTDEIIEKYHKGTSVAEIFKTEGEDYFRTCETEVIKQLTPYRNCIISTGGGAVIKRENWAHMQQGIVVWLDGSAEILAQRVVAQGPEKRPLLYTDGTTPENALQRTTERLGKLLLERRPLYESADIAVPLEGSGKDAATGAPPPVVLYRVMQALDDRIKETNREREARKSISVQSGGNINALPKMQARESTAQATEPAQQ